METNTSHTQTILTPNGIYVSSNVLLFSGGLLIGLMLGVLIAMKFAKVLINTITPMVPFSSGPQSFQK